MNVSVRPAAGKAPQLTDVAQHSPPCRAGGGASGAGRWVATSVCGGGGARSVTVGFKVREPETLIQPKRVHVRFVDINVAFGGAVVAKVVDKHVHERGALPAGARGTRSAGVSRS
ncbi:hypothetical protein GCM10027157_20110 [Corynebacterium aquatimens]